MNTIRPSRRSTLTGRVDRDQLLDAAVGVAVLADVAVPPEQQVREHRADERRLRGALGRCLQEFGGASGGAAALVVRPAPVDDQRARGGGVGEDSHAGVHVRVEGAVAGVIVPTGKYVSSGCSSVGCVSVRSSLRPQSH